MEIRYCPVSTKEELEQILALQQANLWANVSPEEKEKDGFVTVEHNFGILYQMNEVCPHIIAKDGDTVAAYALCMDPMFADKIEILKPMFAEIENVVPKKEKYIAMGQICVGKNYRNQGIFRGLYNAMKAHVRPEFDSIITEVDAKNTRSLQAHYAVGFKELKTYYSDDRDWVLIRLK
ncbi:GCN5 family acetyltransferase [Sediminicola sp. YIK13]|uniref:GNAT family N-acetyltransferase n=1 Tax=Sediminicola sp. YIK13 TaxID=1453352 RepID=UPI0007225E43|nr:GNAT family N-acetyltransferase [Sediminicola sp. YIK13]ALM08682.1 GCN5 family acetyltransferase [Sediminicola sp. YIK13]